MDDIFEGIDIYVQPYVCRRLDLRLLEAMAAGVVVVGRNGGAVDMIRDGVNGLELTGDDAGVLAATLARLLEDRPAARRIGEQARQFIQAGRLAGVTVQRVVERVKQIALGQQTLKIA
jgi:glycosyltransferase involved in cell wall biosynthesis